MLSYSINSPLFMKPEGSLPNSKGPDTRPCPEPDQSSPCCPYNVLNFHFNIILHSTRGFSKRSHYHRFLHQKPLCTSPLPHTCYMPARLILLDFITRYLVRVNIMKLLIMYSSPIILYYILPL